MQGNRIKTFQIFVASKTIKVSSFYIILRKTCESPAGIHANVFRIPVEHPLRHIAYPFATWRIPLCDMAHIPLRHGAYHLAT